MLDATRGIAVLGILIMNITGFGLPRAYDDPTNWGGSDGLNLAAWRIAALFFEGTMRGMFTLLFGAGALLFLQRHAARNPGLLPADLYFRRTMWLIVFGLVNAYLLLWPGDVLYYYGVVGLLLFVCRNVGPRKLIVAAAVSWCCRPQCGLEGTLSRASVAAARAPAGRSSGKVLTAAQSRRSRTSRGKRGVQTGHPTSSRKRSAACAKLRQRARLVRRRAVLRNHVLPAARHCRMPRHDATRNGAAETRRADRRGVATRLNKHGGGRYAIGLA